MKVFCAVVDNGSFAAAAGKMSLSRAMVTKHVMNLENRLNVRLLNRTTRRLSLTEAGASYYDRCSQILNELEDAEANARQTSAEPRGTLRMTAPYSFATMHVAPFLPEFLSAYPDLKLDVTLNDRFVDLVEEGYDLALRVAGPLPESTLVARKLAPCRTVVCASPAYLEQHGEPKSPDELHRHNCLVYTVSPAFSVWTFAHSDGRRHVARTGGNTRSNSGDMLRAEALSGSGIVFLPTFLVGDDLTSGQLKPLLERYETPQFSLYAVYPSRRHLSAKVRALFEFLAGKYGEAPYWDRWLEEAVPGGRNTPKPREGEALAGA